MNVFDKGLVTNLACNALISLLSLPLVLRIVPRNPLYGFRTRATMGDDEVWYAANAFFGRRLLAGSILSAGCAAILYRWPGIPPAAYLNLSVLLLMAPALAAALLTARFVHSRHK